MSQPIKAKISQFFQNYPRRSYPKGQILIHAGDTPKHILFLTKGKVRQYDISYRGDEIIVNIFKPGAFFPMIYALTTVDNRYFFDVEQTAELHQAPTEQVLEFISHNPDVLKYLLTNVYIGVDGVLGRMVQLMSGNARTRLIYELTIEARRFGQAQPDGSIIIRLTESDLAARAGLSRETVSREISKLSQAGRLTTAHKQIVVVNIEALESELKP